MATFYSGKSAYVQMALRITETDTDVNANTSSISWALVAWFVGTDASQWYSNTSHDISVVINGATVFNRGSGTKVTVSVGTDHASESNPVTIASGTTTIAHNSDGAKTISASFSMVYKWDTSKAWSASGTMALTQIARASQPSCITYPNTTEDIGVLGGSIYIHANRASSSFTHTMRYAWGTLSGTIATNVGDNCKWTIPNDFATQIPNQSTGWGTIYCDTYLNGTLIGTKSVGFKASVPLTMQPKGSFTAAKTRSYGPDLYVQGVDQLKVTITASGQYGASITSITTKIDGSTYSGTSFTTSIINASGTVGLTITLTDSRGSKTTIAGQVRFFAYSPPQISASAYRCNASGGLDASGAYICVKGSGTITSLNNQNGRLYTVYWKKTTESAWNSKAITMASYTLDQAIIVAADTSYSYNIRARLQDGLKAIDYNTADVMSAFAFIDVLTASETDDTKKGMAIGKAAEVEGAVDIGWNLIARKGFTWQGMPLTYFTPTVNVSGEYYGKYGCYAKIGHVAIVVLMVQIKSVSGSVPSEIQITLPDALKAIDHWLQPSHPIVGQWGGTFLGVFRQNQNSAVLTVLPASSVTAGTYLANGCYTFFVQ